MSFETYFTTQNHVIVSRFIWNKEFGNYQNMHSKLTHQLRFFKDIWIQLIRNLVDTKCTNPLNSFCTVNRMTYMRGMNEIQLNSLSL